MRFAVNRPTIVTLLPKKFHTIDRIQSVEFKLKLTEILVSIFGILEKADVTSLNPRTKMVVDRFLDFLTDSCESIDAINRRARWLYSYAEAVHCLLLMGKDNRNPPMMVVEMFDDDHLVSRIARLVDGVSAYRVVPNHRVIPEHQMLEVLDNIVELGKLIKPDLGENAYVVLAQRIEMLTNTLAYLNGSEARDGAQVEMMIYSRLIEIDLQMKTYSVTHSYRM